MLCQQTSENLQHLKRVGYKDRDRYMAHEQLQKDYDYYTQSVRKIYDDLFREKGEEAEREKASDAEIIVGDVWSDDEVVLTLSKYNFKDPRKAYRNIILLRDGAPFSHQTPRSRQIFLRIFPGFFRQITSSSDPDHALNNLEALISSAGARETLYSFFEDNHQAIESVIKLFSSSEYLSKTVIRHPEIVDLFLDPSELLEKKTKEKLQRELFSAIEQCGTYVERLDILRKFKYTEELRIGYLDIMGYVDTVEASKYISALADVSVAGALKMAEEEIGNSYGEPVCSADRKNVRARFCVISMGKLGGEEITYGSDLDIVFLYSGEGETDGKHSISNHEYFSHLSSKIISALTSITREGTVFKVDVRLRPSGSKGPLCQSIDAFRSYMKEHVDIWELQSLTRARVIAGDESLGHEFIELNHNLLYKKPALVNLAGSIRGMRQRMEAEVSKEDSSYYDIKVGRGGIVDIEFIVQYLKLLYGSKCAGIRVTNTLLSLYALFNEGLLKKDKYSVLKKSYIFLRTLESRLRIVHNMPSPLLPKDLYKLTSLAKRMGYKDTKRVTGPGRLLKEFESMR